MRLQPPGSVLQPPRGKPQVRRQTDCPQLPVYSLCDTITPPIIHFHRSHIQTSPRPMEGLRQRFDNKSTTTSKRYFVCKAASAGTRHSLLLMVNMIREGNSSKKARKVMICGLNQLALCEERGMASPVDVPWDTGGARLLPASLPVCLSIYPSIYLSIYLSINLSIFLSV